MAPVETEGQQKNGVQLTDPLYSSFPATAVNGNEQYEYAKYKVCAVLGIAQHVNSSVSRLIQPFPGSP